MMLGFGLNLWEFAVLSIGDQTPPPAPGEPGMEFNDETNSYLLATLEEF